MATNQDVPAQVFFNQIGNTTVRSVLTSTGSLPDSISPSAFLFHIVDALDKAQVIFNSENGSLPNVATISGRELGPTASRPDGKLQAEVFYTIGGKLVFDLGSAEPILL